MKKNQRPSIVKFLSEKMLNRDCFVLQTSNFIYN